MDRGSKLSSLIDNIIMNIEGLRGELITLCKNNEELKDKLKIQSFEMELCKHVEKARAVVKENEVLKQENQCLRKQIELTEKSEEGKDLKIGIDYETVKQLYNKGQGLTAYKIGAMFGYSQNGIRAMLKKHGDWIEKPVGNQFRKVKVDG